MNTPFTFEPETFEYAGGPGRQRSEFQEHEMWEIGSPETFEYEGGAPAPTLPPPALAGAALARAVASNRVMARQLGWGCVAGGIIRPIPQLLTFIGLGASATEDDLARAIARWQQTNLRQQGDGQLGPGTWTQMLRKNPPVLPAIRFTRLSFNVNFNGRKLGVLEKTAVYGARQSATHGGVEIQAAFRVTDMDAVRRAGFVDGSGEPHFRWIQMLELRRIGIAGAVESTVQQLRKRGHGYIIDPTTALLPLDPHPYYWYESSPPSPGFHISNYLNRQAPNGLCYNLLFYDRPNVPFAAAQPGRRAYFNFETALVGVRPTRRNVVLNTLLWGFDLVRVNGGSTLRVSKLRAGTYGGSPAFKLVMSKEIQAGSFPGPVPRHCFVGSGFSRAATCT